MSIRQKLSSIKHKIISIRSDTPEIIEELRAHLFFQDIQTKGVASELDIDLLNGKGGVHNLHRALMLFQSRLGIEEDQKQSISDFWKSHSSFFLTEQIVSKQVSKDVLKAITLIETLVSILTDKKHTGIHDQLGELFSRHLNPNDMRKLRKNGALFSRHFVDKSQFYDFRLDIQKSFPDITYSTFTREFYRNIRLLDRFTTYLSQIIDKKNLRNLSPLPNHSGIKGYAMTRLLGLDKTGALDIKKPKKLTLEHITDIRRIGVITGIPLSLRLQKEVQSNRAIISPTEQLASKGRYIQLKKTIDLAINHRRIYNLFSNLRNNRSLSNFFTDFQKIEGRIQWHEYHNFPVDEHSLQVLRGMEFLLLLSDFLKENHPFKHPYENLFMSVRPITDETLNDYKNGNTFRLLKEITYLYPDLNNYKLPHYIKAVENGDSATVKNMAAFLGGDPMLMIESHLKAVKRDIPLLKPIFEDKVKTMNLIFGIIFHDIGKGLIGVGHERLGADSLEETLKPLGLDKKSVKTLKRIVRYHALLNAFKQDHTAESNPIYQFLAEQITDPLLLYGLTVADRIGGHFSLDQNTTPNVQANYKSLSRTRQLLRHQEHIGLTNIDREIWFTTQLPQKQISEHVSLLAEATTTANKHFMANMGIMYTKRRNNNPTALSLDHSRIHKLRAENNENPQVYADLDVRITAYDLAQFYPAGKMLPPKIKLFLFQQNYLDFGTVLNGSCFHIQNEYGIKQDEIQKILINLGIILENGQVKPLEIAAPSSEDTKSKNGPTFKFVNEDHLHSELSQALSSVTKMEEAVATAVFSVIKENFKNGHIIRPWDIETPHIVEFIEKNYARSEHEDVRRMLQYQPSQIVLKLIDQGIVDAKTGYMIKEPDLENLFPLASTTIEHALDKLKKSFRPRLSIYGFDRPGLAGDIIYFLNHYGIDPVNLHFFTARQKNQDKELPVVDEILISPKQAEELKTKHFKREINITPIAIPVIPRDKTIPLTLRIHADDNITIFRVKGPKIELSVANNIHSLLGKIGINVTYLQGSCGNKGDSKQKSYLEFVVTDRNDKKSTTLSKEKIEEFSTLLSDYFDLTIT
jgi:hypothetical protein